MIYEDILSTIGKTPLVKIRLPVQCTVYAKIESRNPGGSIKDRIALMMVREAEKVGILKPGGGIVEPTAGNTGIGLAMVAARLGYRAVMVMPENMTVERQKLLRHLGAEIVLTPAGEGMKGAIAKAHRISEEKGYLFPSQFTNPVNAKAQELTAHEIIEDLGSIIPDYFVCGVGTGGTIAGAGRVLKAAYPDIIIVAVQPAKSRALSGGEHHVHGIQGIGAGFIPEVYDPSIVDMIVDVEDEEAIKQARYLAKREGILAGMSSGAAAAACLGLPEGCAAVTIFPDTAERYISTDLYEVR